MTSLLDRDANVNNLLDVIDELQERIEILERNAVTEMDLEDISARVYNSADFTHNSTGNFLSITFDSERYDTDDIHSTTTDTDRLTAKTAGRYLVGATVIFTANSTGQRQLRLMKNGSTIKDHSRVTAPSGTINEILRLSTTLYLAVGDYLQCQAYQNSGGNLDLVYSDDESPVFWIVKIPDR